MHFRQKTERVNFFLTLICLSFCLTTKGQLRLPYLHYTKETGLANSDVYVAVKDSHGNLWFSTNDGLACFDGARFKNYSIKDGLSGSSLTGMVCINDTLFVASYRKGIQRLYNGKTVGSPFMVDSKLGVNDLNVEGKTLVIESNQMIEGKFYTFRYPDGVPIRNYIPTGKKNGVFTYLPQKKETILLCNSAYSCTIAGKEEITCLDRLAGGDFLIGYAKRLIRVNPDGKIVKEYPLPALTTPLNLVTEDDFGRIWFKTWYGEAYVYIEGNTYRITDLLSLPSPTLIRNIFYDADEKKIWILTGGEGVFCILSPFLSNYQFSPLQVTNRVTALELDNTNALWIGTDTYPLHFDGQNVSKLPLPEQWGNKFIRLIKNVNDTVFIQASGTTGSLSFRKKKIVFGLSTKTQLGYYNHRMYDQYLASASDSKTPFQFQKNIRAKGAKAASVLKKLEAFHRGPSQNHFIINHFYSVRDTLWLCSNDGLGFLHDNMLEFPFENTEFLNQNVRYAQHTPDGDLWVITDENIGILKARKWFFHRNFFKGISIRAANTFAFDSSGRLWLGTDSGLFGIHTGKIFHFNKKSGLIDEQITRLLYDDERNVLWVGTNNGLSRLSIALLENHRFPTPVCQIRAVSTLDRQIHDSPESIEVPFQKNYIKFHLTTRKAYYPNEFFYQHALDDITRWRDCDSIVEFSSLNDGEHCFWVKSKTFNSDWSTPTLVRFRVIPPFYRTFWFWAISLVLAGGGIYRWFIYRKAQNQLELVRQQENVLLRMQSLSAIMNPHFIFNALSSIQYRITPEQISQARDYLSQMSLLIRMNLNSIVEAETTIQKEIERLELYLSLERLRFEDHISYQINIDESAASYLEYSIPTMMIQPFVENAVWHGINPPARKGKIGLLFSLSSPDVLCIQITDDGPGFASSPKSINHISRGMSIIQERIELINKITGDTRNRIDISSSSAGTTVSIYLVTTTKIHS